MKKIFIISGLVLLTSCTDADRQQMTTFGSAASIVCYSGGKEIYRGKSTGKTSAESQSDDWYFKDAATGKLVRVSGNCVIEN